MHLLNRISLLSLKNDRRNAFVIIGAGLVLFSLLFILILTPLRRSIAVKEKKWKELEVRLLGGRSKLTSSFKSDIKALKAQLAASKKRLPLGEFSTSDVLNELTKRAKQLNIEFISIAPRLETTIAPRTAAGTLRYKIVPIEINMSGTYKNIGRYLGGLEDMENIFATAGVFKIIKNEKTFPRLNAKLVVYTYIIKDDGGKE